MISTLLKNDMRYMKKDPMMIMTLFLPFILIIVYQGLVNGLPIIFGEIVKSYISFYEKPLQYVMITMGSSMPGVVMSLRILDDKDEHMLAFYAISPLRLSGYFLYRSIGSSIVSFLAAIIACLGIMGSVPIGFVGYVTALGVLLTLTIGILAKNKLQGMVCMKLTGIVVILPCIRLLGENEMTWILRCQPWDYAYELMMNGYDNKLLWMGYSILVVILCTLLLVRAKAR